MSIKDVFYKKEVVLEDQTKLTSSIESVEVKVFEIVLTLIFD